MERTERIFETDGSQDGLVSRQVYVLNELGLHARPAARLAQEAQRFNADIRLVCREQEVDAKSILDILTLSAGKGVGMEIRADGPDARLAVDHLASLFESRFDEAR